jgi:hypothetical protein
VRERRNSAGRGGRRIRSLPGLLRAVDSKRGKAPGGRCVLEPFCKA